MPNQLKSGSGHHRLEIRGPLKGCHKIAQDRPDFDMLRSLPVPLVISLILSLNPMPSSEYL